MTAPPPGAAALPGLPRDDQGSPVFREPWQAQAFAMAVRLHQAGHFTWTEWAAALAEQIRRAQAAGDPDLGDTYYLHWLAALEQLVAAKGLVSAGELAQRKHDWAEAARAAPHGAPIELPPR
ncbi:MAG TPA: nitrile hydratase accessory protein [Kofleriaceae bacterium]|nr:nitrile hydratase accessory protein [Kofleriaceae bacterium]